MNPMQSSHEELKDWFRPEDIQPVDVAQGVMNGIRSTKAKRHYKLWLRAGIVMAALLVIIMPTGSAIMNWDFFNSRGELTMTIKQMEPDMSSDQKLRDSIRVQIQSGHAAVIYKIGENGLTSIINPIMLTDLNDVKAGVHVPVKFPTLAPRGYSFMEGNIHYMTEFFKITDIEAVLAKEARENGEGVAFREIGLTNEPIGYRLVYSNAKKQEIYVSASFTPSQNGVQSKTIYTSGDGSGSQKVQIGTNQGLYSPDKDTNSLMWVDVDQDRSIWYTIHSPAKNGLTKEDLVNLATNMK